MKVHIAPIFFYPNHFLSGLGWDYLRSDYKISLLQWLFFFSKNNLEQYIYLNVLDYATTNFFKFKKRKKEKPTVTEVTIFKRCQNNRIQQIFSHLFSMFSINQHALQNEIKKEQWRTISHKQFGNFENIGR